MSNTDWQDHLENHLDLIRDMLTYVGNRLNSLKPGEHIQNGTLAEETAKAFESRIKLTGDQFYPIMRPFLNEFPGIQCKRGPKGGIYKL